MKRGDPVYEQIMAIGGHYSKPVTVVSDECMAKLKSEMRDIIAECVNVNCSPLLKEIATLEATVKRLRAKLKRHGIK